MAEWDRERWAERYRGYSAFYEVPAPDLDHLWRRLTAEGEMECFVAELDGEMIGLAHLRAFARPLEGDTAGFLDDLFVDPARRGSGAGAALLEHLRPVAAERRWGVVTCITGADNHIARQLIRPSGRGAAVGHVRHGAEAGSRCSYTPIGVTAAARRAQFPSEMQLLIWVRRGCTRGYPTATL